MCAVFLRFSGKIDISVKKTNIKNAFTMQKAGGTSMEISDIVLRKIDGYKFKGGLDQTAKLFLKLASMYHQKVKEHSERVALLSEEIAIRTGKDPKPAFIGALMHDNAKILLPYDLFDDRNISEEEYQKIKKHPVKGFEILKDFHEFTAMCAGLHHALYESGYGLTLKDFPPDWDLELVKKALDISVIISIADFIDAFTHRKTSIKDGSDKGSLRLEEMLKAKYPNDHQAVEVALKVQKELNM